MRESIVVPFDVTSEETNKFGVGVKYQFVVFMQSTLAVPPAKRATLYTCWGKSAIDWNLVKGSYISRNRKVTISPLLDFYFFFVLTTQKDEQHSEKCLVIVFRFYKVNGDGPERN